MKPKLKNIIMELTSETTLIGVIPFSVHYFEANVFIGRTSAKTNESKVSIFRTGRYFEGRSLGLIDEVGIENIELIALHHFRGRVIHIVMGLIVFIPFKSCVNSIENNEAFGAGICQTRNTFCRFF